MKLPPAIQQAFAHFSLLDGSGNRPSAKFPPLRAEPLQPIVPLRRGGVTHHAIGARRAVAIPSGGQPSSTRRSTRSSTEDAWGSLLTLFAPLFNVPTAQMLLELLMVSVLCTAGPTALGMMLGGGVVEKRSYDDARGSRGSHDVITTPSDPGGGSVARPINVGHSPVPRRLWVVRA